MTKKSHLPYVCVEKPTIEAMIDFLSEGVTVTATIENGKLRIKATMLDGEEASTWDLHEIEWPLNPKYRENK